MARPLITNDKFNGEVRIEYCKRSHLVSSLSSWRKLFASQACRDSDNRNLLNPKLGFS
ncbi:unnamed protein product [Ilex paraguariensis]|uniref:Uncharacterized protein n=1 Tax=Ilex paraguariensis TaxID=185542 RepID=A0ABC8QPJ3_9AQUA